MSKLADEDSKKMMHKMISILKLLRYNRTFKEFVTQKVAVLKQKQTKMKNSVGQIENTMEILNENSINRMNEQKKLRARRYHRNNFLFPLLFLL